MTRSHLIRKELFYHHSSLILGLLSVTVATTATIGAVSLLRANALLTERILDGHERAAQMESARMEDDYRRIMRDLGHNVMILSDAQDLNALRAMGYPEETLPYASVERLAKGGVKSLNHLLPVLQRRVVWPEHATEIILSGTPGQVPIINRAHFLTPDGGAYRDPIVRTIPRGELVVGFNVAAALNLGAGDTVTLMGDTFRIRSINPSEGTTDDIAVWCDLAWMQEKLDMDGRINLILALQCVCHAEAIGEITAEIRALLPDTQVIEFSSRVRARALARARAAEASRLSIEAERNRRREIDDAQRRFAAIMTPLVIGAAVIWMVFIFLDNARSRFGEIAILRAIGLQERAILSSFVIKGLLIGLIGAVVGFVAGFFLGALWAGVTSPRDWAVLMDWRLCAATLLIAPTLCALAVLPPAIWASKRDPAKILCQI